MTVFRSDLEPDPTPGAVNQITESGELAKPELAKTTFTGQDAGLAQSLADLRQGYERAAKIQSEGDRQAAIQRAMVDAKIKENTPSTAVEFIGHKPEQYQAGDSSLIPSSDPAWSIPTEKLRENLTLAEQLYGRSGALNKLLQTGSPKDAAHAAELEDRLRRSIGESSSSLPPIELPASQPTPEARPETFPDGEVYQLETRPDGQLEVRLITGEIFRGDPIEVTRKIAAANVYTKRWAQQQRAQAQQQQPQNGELPQAWEEAPTTILPASGVQYDLNGAPIIEPGQTVAPDAVYENLQQMATALGYHGLDELLADQADQRARTNRLEQELAAEREDRQNRETAAVFLAQNPDFPNNDQSIAALDQILASNGLEYNPQHMAMAHQYAVQNRIYEPLSQADQEAAVGMAVQSRRPTPPPMIRTGNPERGWQGENDPYKIPLEDLRKQAIRQQLEGKTTSLEYR